MANSLRLANSTKSRANEYWALALVQSNRLMRTTFPSAPGLDREFVVAAWRGRHTIDPLTEDSSRALKSNVGLHIRLEVATNTAFRRKEDAS